MRLQCCWHSLWRGGPPARPLWFPFYSFLIVCVCVCFFLFCFILYFFIYLLFLTSVLICYLPILILKGYAKIVVKILIWSELWSLTNIILYVLGKKKILCVSVSLFLREGKRRRPFFFFFFLIRKRRRPYALLITQNNFFYKMKKLSHKRLLWSYIRIIWFL